MADIQTVENVDCIHVSAGAASADNDKRLKTASSERFIPIHPTLGDLGFLAFVTAPEGGGWKEALS